MTEAFDYFAVFAGMRTGSNFLEERLNEFAGLECHGELFNTHFVGKPNTMSRFGLSLAEREADPLRMLDLMRSQADGLSGFRIFGDHDRRVVDHCISDPRCGKIVLIRNPVDSYVSLNIARSTGQWWLGDATSAKSSKVTYDPDAFQKFLNETRAFQMELQRGLQRAGLTAFYIHFDDLSDDAVLEGAARYLGVTPERKGRKPKGKVQNPLTLEDKVVNFEEMARNLARSDFFDLSRIPNFEPARGPVTPSYLAAKRVPLLFMPVKGGPNARVTRWLADIDQTAPDALATGMTQRALRKWKRQNPGHRSIVVVRHPIERAHSTFVDRILADGPETLADVRAALRNTYKLPLPDDAACDNYDVSEHRAAFSAFLGFLKANLGGQTGLRVDPSWASQSAILMGMSKVNPPDLILREDELDQAAEMLSMLYGIKLPKPGADTDKRKFSLADIYDAKLEAAARAAYQRDYMMFGFRRWRTP